MSEGSEAIGMDNYTENATLTTRIRDSSPHDYSGFLSYNLICLIFILIPFTILNSVLIILLCKDSNNKTRAIRFLLGNIPASCLVVSIGLIMLHFSGILLHLTATSADLSLCRVTLFVIAFGGIARILFMAFFAFNVFLIVRCREQTIAKNFVVFVIMAVVLWIASVVCALPVAIDEAVNVTYGNNVSCGPVPSSIGSYIYMGLYALLFGIISFALTVFFLLLTIGFICRNTVSANEGEMNKAMLKLGFFLLLGNVMSIVGQILPAVIATLVVDPHKAEEGDIGTFSPELTYSTYVLINLSLIPSPILIMIYFNPIRTKVRRFLCCRDCKERNSAFRDRSSTSSVHLHATNMMAGSKRLNSLSSTAVLNSP